jgi:hypothetical protein
VSDRILTMTAAVMNEAIRRLFTLRLSPSVFLLPIAFFAGQAMWEGTVASRLTSPQTGVYLIGLSLIASIAAALISSYQAIRHRSLQHVAEIALAVWLFARIADPMMRFTHG